MTELSEATLEELLLEMRGAIGSKGEAIAIKPTKVFFTGLPANAEEGLAVIRIAQELIKRKIK